MYKRQGEMELARLPALKELEDDCMFSRTAAVKALEAARASSSSWSGVPFLAQESTASDSAVHRATCTYILQLSPG